MNPVHLVLDSSVLLKWFVQDNERGIDRAQLLLADLRKGRIRAFCPELAKLEVLNVLLCAKNYSVAEGKDAIDTLGSLPITWKSLEEDQLLRAFEIGKMSNISFYDAAFIALAEVVSGLLVTDNVKHQGKMGNENVIPLLDYTPAS